MSITEDSAPTNAVPPKRVSSSQQQKAHSEQPGSRLIKAAPRRVSRSLKVELAQHQARPIVVVGIGLVAAIIISLIILITTTEPFGKAVQNMDLMPMISHNPWTLSAFLLLLYCVGACIGFIILAFGKIRLKRGVRYALAAFSAAGFIAIVVLCIMALLGSVFSSSYFYGMCRGMIFIRWPLLLLMGLAFGLAMPVGEEADETERIRRQPRRLRVLLAMSALAWMCCVFVFLYLWIPAKTVIDSGFVVLFFLDASIAGPLLVFFACGLLVAVGFLYLFPIKPSPTPKVLPHALVYCLLCVPAIVIFVFCLISVLTLFSEPFALGLYKGLYASPAVIYAIFAVEGCVFGAGVANMKS